MFAVKNEFTKCICILDNVQGFINRQEFMIRK